MFNVQKNQDLEAIFLALNVTQIWTETLVSETSEIVSAATGFSPLHATQSQTISYPGSADLSENSVLTLKRLGPNVFSYVATLKIEHVAAICAENLSFPKGAQDIIELTDFRASLAQNIELSLELLNYVKKRIASLVISMRKLHSSTAPSHTINYGFALEEKFLELKRSWKSVVLDLERISRPNQLVILGRRHDSAVKEFEVLLNKILEPLLTPQTCIPLEIIDTNGLGPAKISSPQNFVSNDGSIIIQFSEQSDFERSTVSTSTTILPLTSIPTWTTTTIERGGGFDLNKLWDLRTNFELPKTVPDSFLTNWWTSGQPWSISLIDLILSTFLILLWSLYLFDSIFRFVKYCKKRKSRQNRLLKVNKLHLSKTLPTAKKSNVRKNSLILETKPTSPPHLDSLKFSPIRPSEVISRIRKIKGRANLAPYDKTTRPIIEETIITRVCRNCRDSHPLKASRLKSHKPTKVEVYPELVTEPVINKRREATIPLYRADSLLSIN